VAVMLTVAENNTIYFLRTNVNKKRTIKAINRHACCTLLMVDIPYIIVQKILF